MSGGYDWVREMKASERSSTLTTGQGELLPLPLTSILNQTPQGQHIELVGFAGESLYYCKSDSRGGLVCATEWFYTSLAHHLGIAVPDFDKILNRENGELLFGSKGVSGIADEFEVQTFLMTAPVIDPVIGDPYPWLGSHISRIYALDVFASNPDRQLRNYLLAKDGRSRKLLAYDFASTRLIIRNARHFGIAGTQTEFVGRNLRRVRAFDESSALELVDNLGAVPLSEIEKILATIPEEWLTEDQRGKVYDQWSNGSIKERVSALRHGLKDGSLL